MVKIDDEEWWTHLWQIHIQPRLPGIVTHFEYNNSESANLIEMLFNHFYEKNEPFWRW